MRNVSRCIVSRLVLLVLIGATVRSLAQTATFRADVNLVTITFSVRNGERKLVDDLRLEEVEVLEDRIPQKLKFFARTAELPLTVGLIVDVSDSQHSFFKQHHAHVEKFLRDVLGPQDRAFLVCFGNHVRLISDLTSSVSQIMAGFGDYEGYLNGRKGANTRFAELGPPEARSEGTAFFDSIVYATRERLGRADRSRRALVIFSDGEDNASAYHLIDAIESAQAADVLVYNVRYTEPKKDSARGIYGTRVMQRLSRDTGGMDFDATQDPDLDKTFREIGAELRTLYEVGYYSNNPVRDETFRKISVATTRPGITIRAKAGYFARP